MSRDEFKFWIILLLLNSILFLPGYLFNSDTSHFFPFRSGLHETNTLFVRSNMDVFRISVDLFLLVFISYFFRKYINSHIYGWLSGLYFVIMLIFLTYFNGFEKLYHDSPLIFNDLSLLKLGFFNVGGQSTLISVGFFLFTISALAALMLAVKRLTDRTHTLRLKNYSKAILIFLCSLWVVNSFKSGLTFDPHHTFQETFALIADNVKRSADARKNIRSFDVDLNNRKLGYNEFHLKKKPDIYLLFIESYGKLLYRNSYLKKPFMNCLDSCERGLRDKGWNMVSNFSISPVSGGKSWVSYTSVMFGYNIRNQGTYNLMLKDKSMGRYDNLFKILKKKGYKTFRLAALPQNPNMKIPWDAYSDFYSIDKWIRFRDLKYTGKLYGLGPSPPDQYSINFADEYIKESNPGPHALFFITQTSHHPFECPDSITQDWRTLNFDKENRVIHGSAFLKKPRINNYLKVITYDIDVLSRFISSNSDSTAIFILIGDHQPPIIAGTLDGFETPVHIICRNREFVEGFLQYGFREGLKPNGDDKPIRHEGFYSMFFREFVRFYGTDPARLPEYRPYGLTTNTL